jgi:DNA-3-methyladenine glycosylase II
MSHYLNCLQKDKKLAAITRHYTPFQLQRRKRSYLQLCKAIIVQQLSVKAAAAIKSRFLNLSTTIPEPIDIAQTSYEELRSIGLSHAKAN